MDSVAISAARPGIALITMNRPANRNAMSPEIIDGLKAALKGVGDDRQYRVAVLTGAGKGFCSGADLSGGRMPQSTEGYGPVGAAYRFQEELMELVLLIREMQKPVIAAVNGAALGAGLALALHSDIRIAAKSARFGAVFIRVGLSSCDLGTSYLLPRLVGAGRAAELMLTGRIFDAAEAEKIGLVARVVPDEGLIDSAVETAELIRENSEYGVWMTKQGLWANLDAPSLRHAMELESRTQILGVFTGNMEEAMKAFQEHRKPSWKPL